MEETKEKVRVGKALRQAVGDRLVEEFPPLEGEMAINVMPECGESKEAALLNEVAEGDTPHLSFDVTVTIPEGALMETVVLLPSGIEADEVSEVIEASLNPAVMTFVGESLRSLKDL